MFRQFGIFVIFFIVFIKMLSRFIFTDVFCVFFFFVEVPKSKFSPAYTILYDGIPGKPKIDIDLVPSFVIDGWPVEVAKRINPSWISSDKVVNDSMLSYDVVCKTFPDGKYFYYIFQLCGV